MASEGFRSVDEIAYVEPREFATIEGFDAGTRPIQARAQAHLARIEAEFDEQRKALGVTDELKEIEGLTPPMLVRLGEQVNISPMFPPTARATAPRRPD